MVDGVYLFTTQTCPNCKLAVAMLEKAGIRYTKMLANENKELCEELKIKQAPTLVIINGDSIERVMNVSNIRKFAEELKK